MRTDIEAEGAPVDPAVHRVGKVTINSLDDYERATARVAELAGHVEDSAEERELEALLDAIMKWDKTHDDPTSWR